MAVVSMLLRILAVLFLACLFGLIAFAIGVTIFNVGLLPEQIEPMFVVMVLSNMVAAIGAVLGLKIGPRVFDGLIAWTP